MAQGIYVNLDYPFTGTNARLRISFPDNFSNRLDVYSYDTFFSAPSIPWQVAATGLLTVGHAEIEWNDQGQMGRPAPAEVARRVYRIGNADLDSDSDGLSDARELLTTKTDPDNPDSDGDGMPDGWEVENHLDPLLNDAAQDADGDLFTNLEEYLAGTDPQSAASTPGRFTVELRSYDTADWNSGQVQVIAAESFDAWSSPYSATVASPQTVTLENLPRTSLWVKAWFDANSNGIKDPGEELAAMQFAPTDVLSTATTVTLHLCECDLYVWTNGSDSADGTTPATALRTLQGAMDATTPGDTVCAAAGTYAEGSAGSAHGLSRANLTNSVRLAAIEGPEHTIIQGSASPAIRGIYTDAAAGSTAVLGFTFTGGSATYGGGFMSWYGTSTVSNCVFTQNSAVINGGGLYGRSGVRVANCRFTGNTSSNYGGGLGIENALQTAVVIDCMALSNQAARGGGFSLDNISVIQNSLSAGNYASVQGGGIFMGSNVRSYNLTVTENTSPLHGGLSITGNGTFLYNSIVSGNTNNAGQANDFGANENDGNGIAYTLRAVEYCIIPRITNHSINAYNVWTNAPAFESGTYVPSAGSPAIDAGATFASIMPEGILDLGGNPRIVNDRVDLGAYEAQTVINRPEREWYVAPDGSDNADGSLDTPFATIQHALNQTRPGDSVLVRGGRYRELPRMPAAGTASAPVLLAGFSNEVAIVDGAMPVTGWTPYEGSIWVRSNWYHHTQQVLVDDKPLRRIGFPNAAMVPHYLPYGLGIDDMFRGSFYSDVANNRLFVWLEDNGNPGEYTVTATHGTKALFNLNDWTVVSNMVFQHANGMSLAQFGAYCIVMAPNSTLINTTARNMDGAAICIHRDCRVIGCTITGNGLAGITGNRATDVLIRGSRFEGNNADHYNVAMQCGGIKLIPECTGIIESNVFYRNIGNSIWIDECDSPEPMIVRYNQVYEALANTRPVQFGAGIMAEISKNVWIHDNIVKDTDGIGIIVAESDNCRVFNNTVIGTRDYADFVLRDSWRTDYDGVTVFTLTNNRVFNNLFAGGTCTYDVQWVGDRPQNTDARKIKVADNLLDHNLYARQAGTFRAYYNDTTLTSLAAFQSASGMSTNAVATTQPRLYCPPAGDYSLADASPAINAGNHTLFDYDWHGARDFAGTSRWMGAQIDCGAFEWSARAQPLVTWSMPTGSVPMDITSVSGWSGLNVTGITAILTADAVPFWTGAALLTNDWEWTLPVELSQTGVLYTITLTACADDGTTNTINTQVTRGGIGTGTPDLSVAAAAAAAGYSITVTGTCNQHITGSLWWSNTWNGSITGQGTFTPGSLTWTQSFAGLGNGWNNLTIGGENALGVATQLTIAVDAGGTTDHYVDAASASPAYPYNTPATAARVVQQAVEAAADGDTVHLAAGTYTNGLFENPHGQSRVGVTRGIRLVGTDGPDATVIGGTSLGYVGNVKTNWRVRGIQINHAGAVVEGLTFKQGATRNLVADSGTSHNDGGGGLLLKAQLLTNCVFRDNWSFNFGGGLHAISAAASVRSCRFENNQSARGGGMAILWGGSLSVTDSEFHGNAASVNGGGLLIDNCGGIRRLTIMSNTAARAGGGLFFANGALVYDSVIAHNSDVDNGGGAFMNGFLNQLINTELYNNFSVNGAGGAAMRADRNVISNSVIRANHSTSGPGGVRMEGGTNSLIGSEVILNTSDGFVGGVRLFDYNNITDTLIQWNLSRSTTGGVYASESAILSNVTITNNHQNLLYNHDFETAATDATAAYWTAGSPDTNGDYWGSAERVNWRSWPDTNGWCLAIRGTWAGAGNFGGAWQQVPASPGQAFTVRAWYWADAHWAPDSQGIKLEFCNAAGVPLVEHATNITDSQETWREITATAIAPANTAFARATLFAGGTGESGALCFDRVLIEPME